MRRTIWITVVAAAVALALGVSGTLLWIEWRNAQTPEAPTVVTAPDSTTDTAGDTAQPDEPSATPPAEDVPDTAPAEPVESEPTVAVTAESGESYCYVRDAFSRDGRRFVVLDYIELGADLGMSEDYEIINNNPRLRTFEVTGDSYIGAFWMAVELYGDSRMEEWDDYSVEGDWLGVPLAWEDLVAAVGSGTVNDYSYWFVRVDQGRVVRLINTYQD